MLISISHPNRSIRPIVPTGGVPEYRRFNGRFRPASAMNLGGGRPEPHFIKECMKSLATSQKRSPKSLAEQRLIGI
jgi:hypothetical protein